MEHVIRRATNADVEQLVEMRCDFTFEDLEPHESTIRPGYAADCRRFLENAIALGNWHIRVADADGEIVAHLFVALIDKVPRPVRANSKIAYLTNVYTRPSHRGQGIGAQLLRRAQQAADDDNVELMIVWPSEASVPFYARHGFGVPIEPLIWEPPDQPPKQPT
jgi:GNAT superfamily N-acetyltransferase